MSIHANTGFLIEICVKFIIDSIAAQLSFPVTKFFCLNLNQAPTVTLFPRPDLFFGVCGAEAKNLAVSKWNTALAEGFRFETA
jgi:hypothetical protein